MQTKKNEIKILLLEDNDADAEIITHALNRSGLAFEIQRAEEKKNFLNLLDHYTPDVIIADYNLPRYNGRQAYLDMVHKGHRVPFILVTGSLPDDIAVECLKAGIDDYILKDRLNRLPEAIQSVLTKWRLEEEKKHTLEKLVQSEKQLRELNESLEQKVMERTAELNRANELLKEYQHFFNNNNDLCGIANTTGYFEKINANFSKVLGYSEPEFAAIPFIDLVHPDDKLSTLHEYSKLLEGATVINFINRYRTIHGTYLYLDWNATPNPLTGKLYCVARNITERKIAEEQLSAVNKQLAQRNHEIIDSIHYARRIQRAIIHKPAEKSTVFNERFTLLMPKDILSGDFFWYHAVAHIHIKVLVDCTGHGVPAALMSLIAHQFLNQIVIEEGCLHPAEILKELDRKLVESLHQYTADEVRDGMDVALCRIDSKEKTVSFAGALRPLFYFNGSTLAEIPGSRHTIGGFISNGSNKTFAQETIHYKSGDCIYLTSDGYYSQFNHYTGKKMMKRRMRNILESVAKKDTREQLLILKRYFNEWKGTTEQVDDVLVVGVKF